VNAVSMTGKLPFAFGGASCRAILRSEPEDFRVDEVTSVEPDENGEHILLRIEKRNANTDWVAGLLARHAGVPRRDVGYAGKKDRRALTRQWYSVRLAGKPEPDWIFPASTEIRVLSSARHSRKLRTGALQGNHFVIRARGLEGDRVELVDRLQCLAEKGMPNYFGEQRFGRQDSNISGALAMFAGSAGRLSQQKRGLYLSAARSLLFNRVLSGRVATGTWNQTLAGERLMLDRSRSSFLPERIDAEILRRLSIMNIHPSGPLWGRGELQVSGEVEQLEWEALAPLGEFREGLERSGLKQERRALRARVSDLSWTFCGNELELRFFLPKGSYATTMLRECLDYRLAAG
jgi:tRNA pseudouridine13 synthase